MARLIEVDTAALAVALEIRPADVRRLVGDGILTPLRRAVVGGRGRPAMWFDATAAAAAVEAAVTSGRVRLDDGRVRLRK